MLCPKCQHRNSDENRFCGHCGCDLTKSAETHYPPEGYEEVEGSQNDAPQVPKFRRDVPPLRQSEYGPPVGSAINEVETPVPEVRETPNQVAPQPPLELPRNYGTRTGILFNLDPQDTRSPSTVSEPEPPVVERPPSRRSEGIHGPSFLGLTDPGDADFLDDLDEPESHARRNWFLVALAIVIVLAAVQWRNIRDTGLNLAGSMKINLPLKKGQPAKPSGDTSSTESHSENGPANNGNPEIVVNPENGNQKAASASGTPDSQANTANGSAQQGSDATKTDDATSASDKAAKPDDQQGSVANSDNASKSGTAKQKSTDNAQPTQEVKNNAGKADDNGDDSDSADTSGADKTTAKAAAKPPTKSARAARAPAEKPAASAGAEDLARANSASSPETAAKWLWASTSKGNLDAPVRLADMYATGRGVPKDCEQATVLLRSSARRGNPRASARLGMYYATGQCVDQDRSQAWHWLSLAHQRDPASDWISQYRQRLWSEMSPDERARAGNTGPSANASE